MKGTDILLNDNIYVSIFNYEKNSEFSLMYLRILKKCIKD